MEKRGKDKHAFSESVLHIIIIMQVENVQLSVSTVNQLQFGCVYQDCLYPIVYDEKNNEKQ